MPYGNHPLHTNRNQPRVDRRKEYPVVGVVLEIVGILVFGAIVVGSAIALMMYVAADMEAENEEYAKYDLLDDERVEEEEEEKEHAIDYRDPS